MCILSTCDQDQNLFLAAGAARAQEVAIVSVSAWANCIGQLDGLRGTEKNNEPCHRW